MGGSPSQGPSSSLPSTWSCAALSSSAPLSAATSGEEAQNQLQELSRRQQQAQMLQAQRDRELCQQGLERQAELFNVQWTLIRDQIGSLSREMASQRHRLREEVETIQTKIEGEKQDRITAADQACRTIGDCGRSVEGLRSFVDAEGEQRCARFEELRNWLVMEVEQEVKLRAAGDQELQKLPGHFRKALEEESRSRRECDEKLGSELREAIRALATDLRQLSTKEELPRMMRTTLEEESQGSRDLWARQLAELSARQRNERETQQEVLREEFSQQRASIDTHHQNHEACVEVEFRKMISTMKSAIDAERDCMISTLSAMQDAAHQEQLARESNDTDVREQLLEHKERILQLEFKHIEDFQALRLSSCSSCCSGTPRVPADDDCQPETSTSDPIAAFDEKRIRPFVLAELRRLKADRGGGEVRELRKLLEDHSATHSQALQAMQETWDKWFLDQAQTLEVLKHQSDDAHIDANIVGVETQRVALQAHLEAMDERLRGHELKMLQRAADAHATHVRLQERIDRSSQQQMEAVEARLEATKLEWREDIDEESRALELSVSELKNYLGGEFFAREKHHEVFQEHLDEERQAREQHTSQVQVHVATFRGDLRVLDSKVEEYYVRLVTKDVAANERLDNMEKFLQETCGELAESHMEKRATVIESLLAKVAGMEQEFEELPESSASAAWASWEDHKPPELTGGTYHPRNLGDGSPDEALHGQHLSGNRQGSPEAQRKYAKHEDGAEVPDVQPPPPTILTPVIEHSPKASPRFGESLSRGSSQEGFVPMPRTPSTTQLTSQARTRTTFSGQGHRTPSASRTSSAGKAGAKASSGSSRRPSASPSPRENKEKRPVFEPLQSGSMNVCRASGSTSHSRRGSALSRQVL